MDNNIDFLVATYKNLLAHNIDTCVFGGWAEELRELIKPRKHNDIDLLCLTNDLSLLDAFIKRQGLLEILEKSFEHKRAFKIHDVMVEIILVQPDLKTKFFGTYDFDWPKDTFKDKLFIKDASIPVASVSALRQYRDNYKSISYGRAKAELII